MMGWYQTKSINIWDYIIAELNGLQDYKVVKGSDYTDITRSVQVSESIRVYIKCLRRKKYNKAPIITKIATNNKIKA